MWVCLLFLIFEARSLHHSLCSPVCPLTHSSPTVWSPSGYVYRLSHYASCTAHLSRFSIILHDHGTHHYTEHIYILLNSNTCDGELESLHWKFTMTWYAVICFLKENRNSHYHRGMFKVMHWASTNIGSLIWCLCHSTTRVKQKQGWADRIIHFYTSFCSFIFYTNCLETFRIQLL